MINKAIRLVTIISSIAFLLGILLSIIFHLDKSFSVYWLSDHIVNLNYLFGFVAIISHYVVDRPSVGKQDLSYLNETDQNSSGESDSGMRTHSVNYSGIGQELDSIIKSTLEDKVKCERILSVICNGVNAGQGILFNMVGENDKSKLKIKASYAFVPNADMEAGIGMNDGLVALAVKEDRKIELTDIPKDRVKVFSGLGQAAPSSVLIIPMKREHEMKGVLELSFLGTYDKGIQKFIHDYMDKISILL